MRIVTVEDHYWNEEIAKATNAHARVTRYNAKLIPDLGELGERRLAVMDAAGIDFQVISHTEPCVQNMAPKDAIPMVRDANDELLAAIAKHPNRFGGFASLPTSDPEAAADELERAVRLGLLGGFINGLTQERFLDDISFQPLFERAEALDVPIYLHPAQPPEAVRVAYYDGFPLAFLLGIGAWGWHSETALHILRMVVTGTFDRHPRLRMIIGHMGEMLPFMIGRLDDVLSRERTGLDKTVSEYLLQHLTLSTSGLNTPAPFLCAMMTFGVDKLMFAVDYPYGNTQLNVDRLMRLPMSADDLERVAHGNAERVLGLKIPE
jgi:predicted TIM-barrel fold metal-dependent hydrolase